MKRSLVLSVLGLLAGSAFGQGWTSAYEEGLKLGKEGKWLEARKSFQQAIAYRPEDVSAPTLLPGPPTEQRRWRNGSPYSPNFLAAYCGYRFGAVNSSPEANELLDQVGTELQALLDKKQFSRETFYVLSNVYARRGNVEKRKAVDASYEASKGSLSWKVDTELFTPEELAVLNPQSSGTGTTTPNTTNTNPVQPSVPLTGTIPFVPTKFALVIGQSESRISGGAIPHAADDAAIIREALNAHAGYAPENTEVVLNATATQLRATAKALAARMPEDATLFIYFVGQGVNIDGKDYLAGVDTELATDTASMLPKDELYSYFRAKGAHTYAFFEVPRPEINNRYFGAELPQVGRLAQCNSTMPGESLSTIFRQGKQVGVYANSIADVLAETRNPVVYLKEFCWQVFYKTRKGSTGGNTRQTPTLPMTVNVDNDRGF